MWLRDSYSCGDTRKVIVLMTDGKNTSQYYIDSDFRSGASEIWWNAQEEVYSVYDDYYDEYYWLHATDSGWDDNHTWHDHAYGNQEAIVYCKKYKKNGKCKKWATIPPEPGEAIALDYRDLFAYTSMEQIVEFFYEPWMNDNYAWDLSYAGRGESVGASTRNARTRDICDAAKSHQIVVFTIGFEAPSSGQAVLEDCASSPSHYFDVDGLEIVDAFSAIASSIRQLRLTQ